MQQEILQQLKQLLSQAASLYRNHFKTMAVTSALGLMPVGLLSTVISLSTGTALRHGHVQSVLNGLLAQVFLVFPLYLAGTFLAQAALLVQMKAALEHLPVPGPGLAWAQVLRRAWPLLITSLLVTVGATLGFVLFVLPGVWLLYRCLLTTPVVVFEHRSGLDALGRSAQLVKAAPVAVMYLLGAVGVFSWGIHFMADVVFPVSLAQVGRAVFDALLLPIPLLGVGLFYRHVMHLGLISGKQSW